MHSAPRRRQCRSGNPAHGFQAAIDARDDTGRTPLHWAAAKPCLDCDATGVCRALLERGARVDARDNDGATPLHLAATAAIADSLLRFGADPNAVDNRGGTPLHHVAIDDGINSEPVGVCRALVAAGADLGAKDAGGHTPLDLAIYHDRREVATLLTEAASQGANLSYASDR